MQQLEQILIKGAALHDAGRLEQALALYDAALLRCPDSPLLWNNRGNSLLELARFKDAAQSYRQALQLMPGLYDAQVALATCLQALGQIYEALAETETVLTRSPGHAEAHWNRALLLLLTGRYTEGWQEYEWRWKKRRFTSPQQQFRQPLWHGEAADNRTILIHAEQGFGDTIQFCRYLPLLSDRGFNVLFACHPPLVRLMTTLNSPITVIALNQQLPHFDCHLPLLSLPLLFNTTPNNIPARTAYLTSPPERLPFWQSLLPATDHLRVGLCWAGKKYPDPLRSCPAQLLEPLTTIQGIELFSLQTESTDNDKPPRLYDLTMLIQDFGDTAALISQLDLVITIDTAVAHLAGALGKNTWLLLPFAADWRWGIGGESSDWYSSIRIFRQKSRGDWQGVVDELLGMLNKKKGATTGSTL